MARKPYLREDHFSGGRPLAPDLLHLTAPFTRRRRGVEMRLLAGVEVDGPDPEPPRALAQACAWAAALKSGQSIATLARQSGTPETTLRRRLPLAFLSPRIKTALLEGTLPAGVSVESLLARSLPLDWRAQERNCGIG